LSPLIIWRDWGEESDSHLHLASDLHGEDTSSCGVFKAGLIDWISHIGRGAHPGVGRAVDADEASPASNLAPSLISAPDIVGVNYIDPNLRPEGRPLTDEVP
jgi:hypothetical protein